MNAARFFMRREDYQPNQPRNPSVCGQFNISCVKCESADITIIGEFDEDGGELAVYLYCPRCRVRERLKVR
jgi:hypothetical protein